MILAYALNISLIILLILGLRKYFSLHPMVSYFYPALFLKLLAGICVGILYTQYYTYGGDTIFIHKDSVILTQIFSENFHDFWNIFTSNSISEENQALLLSWEQPRVLFMVKILAVLNFLTFGEYWINSLYLSLFSFVGLWMLGASAIKIFKVSEVAVLISLFFFPSIVFWSSGILKESLAIASLALASSIILNRLHIQRKLFWYDLPVILVLLYIIFQLKFYYAAIFIPALLAYTITVILSYSYLAKFGKAGVFLGYSLVLLALLFVSSQMHPLINFSTFARSLLSNYNATIYASEGHNIFTFPNLEASFSSIARNAPNAIVVGLFRPFFTDISKGIAVLPALENFIIMIFFLTKIISLIKRKTSLTPIALPIVFYVCILATIIPLASPNWGTLVRYKVGYLPFLLLFITSGNIYLEKLEVVMSGFIKRVKGQKSLPSPLNN